MYSGRFFRFIGSSFLPIFYCPLSYISIIYAFLVLNVISWCFVLHIFGHFVNYIIPLSQFTSRLCLTNQSCPRNMFVLFKSITIMLIFSLYLLISTLSSVNHVNFSIFCSICIEYFEWYICWFCLDLLFFNQLFINSSVSTLWIY